MIGRLTNTCRRFVASTRGVAAVEFAMILPVLVVIFLGTFDGGRAIAIYMKVRSSTYALASITNQYGDGSNNTSVIQSADMTTIMYAANKVLAPYPSAPATTTISEIKINSASSATIRWSCTGTTPTCPAPSRALNSAITLPANMATTACGGTYPCYLVFAEVTYAFTPMFGFFTAAGINFSDNLYTTPRSTSCILYVPTTGGTVGTC